MERQQTCQVWPPRVGWREEGRGTGSHFPSENSEQDRQHGRARVIARAGSALCWTSAPAASSQQPAAPPHSTFSSERSARSGGLPALRRTSCEAWPRLSRLTSPILGWGENHLPRTQQIGRSFTNCQVLDTATKRIFIVHRSWRSSRRSLRLIRV